MAIPDNRLRLPATPINFTVDVGITGQSHDNWPNASGQARYDWFRMYFIALLANQSSFEEPTEYRDGTLWFDLNDGVLKIRRTDSWVPLAQAIKLDTNVDESPLTLAAWYSSVKSILSTASPTATFSGVCTTDNQVTITIPEALRGSANSNSRPLVYINGLLLDPRSVEFVGSPVHTSIRLLNGRTLDEGDAFSVLMIGITEDLFHVPSVVV